MSKNKQTHSELLLRLNISDGMPMALHENSLFENFWEERKKMKVSASGIASGSSGITQRERTTKVQEEPSILLKNVQQALTKIYPAVNPPQAPPVPQAPLIKTLTPLFDAPKPIKANSSIIPKNNSTHQLLASKPVQTPKPTPKPVPKPVPIPPTFEQDSWQVEIPVKKVITTTTPTPRPENIKVDQKTHDRTRKPPVQLTKQPVQTSKPSPKSYASQVSPHRPEQIKNSILLRSSPKLPSPEPIPLQTKTSSKEKDIMYAPISSNRSASSDRQKKRLSGKQHNSDDIINHSSILKQCALIETSSYTEKAQKLKKELAIELDAAMSEFRVSSQITGLSSPSIQSESIRKKDQQYQRKLQQTNSALNARVNRLQEIISQMMKQQEMNGTLPPQS